MRRHLATCLATAGLILAPSLLGCAVITRLTATFTPTVSPIVIEKFDGSPAAFSALDQAIRGNPTAVAQAALASLHADDFKVRFAAVYALSLTADVSQAETLKTVLKDDNAGLRTITAGALIGLGEKESIPVLIAALASNERLPYSDPPQPVWTLAYDGLSHYTGQDFGYSAAMKSGDSAARAAAVQAWQDWWAKAGPELHWDESSKRYAP